MLPLTGYSNRLSARPGETVEFKVSSQSKAPYTARLVRVICADANPKGPGLMEEAVASPLDGKSFPARAQPVPLGSYARIDKPADLASRGTVALVATIWPTLPGAGKRQGILSAFDPNTRIGIALAVGEDGSAEALAGAERVKTRVPMRKRTWYRVTAVYDPVTKKLEVSQVELDRGASRGKEHRAEVELSAGFSGPAAGVPWYIGALGGHSVRGHYNGKIEWPMVLSKRPSADDIASVMKGVAIDGLVAAWDFTQGIDTTGVTDIGSGGYHGELVNLPARAMTGASWAGHEMCFRHALAEYAAIHFHEDDLSDCRWETDFTFKVPEGTRSGIYAVRIKSEDGEDNFPFMVVPPRGKKTADICVLMSTYTWTVYHNHARPEVADPVWIKAWKEQSKAWNAYPYNPGEHKDYGLSTYNFHTDGSGICHATWLRPMLTVRLGYITYPYEEIRGSGLRHFPADTHLIAWLEANGYDYDVITDEELDREGLDLIKPYRVVITGSHPEYHTGAMLDALRAFRDGGGRFMYMGGNGFYWKVARHKTAPAAIEIRRAEGGIRAWAAEVGEYYNAFDGEYGGLWRRNGRPPQHLGGVGFTAQGNFVGSYYKVLPAARDSRAGWVFNGVSEEQVGGFGLSGHGAAGFELDRADQRLGTPPHAIILAQSEGHKPEAPWVLVPEEQLTHLLTWSLEPIPKLIRADMVFFEAPNNGAVFSTGSITYCGSLLSNGCNNNISRITKNVLDRFLDPKAEFPMPPGA